MFPRPYLKARFLTKNQGFNFSVKLGVMWFVCLVNYYSLIVYNLLLKDKFYNL